MRRLCSATKAAEADNSGVVHGMSAQHPHASALEQRLQQLAAEISDATPKPFRVDMVRIHGGKPPVYSLVILSYAKEPLRRMRQRYADDGKTDAARSIGAAVEHVEEAQRLAGKLDQAANSKTAEALEAIKVATSK